MRRICLRHMPKLHMLPISSEKQLTFHSVFSEEEPAQYVDGYLESGVLLDALEAAVSEVNSFQLYTAKPFARSAEAKPFCRNHLPRGTKHSAQDYRQRQMIDAGRTRNGKTSV